MTWRFERRGLTEKVSARPNMIQKILIRRMRNDDPLDHYSDR